MKLIFQVLVLNSSVKMKPVLLTRPVGIQNVQRFLSDNDGHKGPLGAIAGQLLADKVLAAVGLAMPLWLCPGRLLK